MSLSAPTLATSLMSYQALKTTSALKDVEEKRNKTRDKAMLIFTFQLLIDKGYLDTATSLSRECGVLNLEEFSICDNIDLRTVFLEFESYYHLRFQRYPQYFRKAGPGSATEALLDKMKANFKKSNSNNINGSAIKRTSDKKPKSSTHNPLEDAAAAFIRSTMENNPEAQILAVDSDDCKLLKPISGLEFINEDIRSYAEVLQREIVMEKLDMKWEDVIGLENAKQVLKESLIYTKEFQSFFGTGLTPWKALLLYGPPGVGKTLLAKVVASQCGTTFFNISTASIVSKWRGDSEKIVKTLFELARYHAPSTIFFDEFDSIGSNRDSGTETDASRRLKSELLQQIDGLTSQMNSQEQIFILAATNLPWDLDPAVLRRLEKRIYIPLPSAEERYEILKYHLQKIAIEIQKNNNATIFQLDLEYLAENTEGYSGSDLKQVVKETFIRKFREIWNNSKTGTGGEKVQHIAKNRKLCIVTQDLLDTLKLMSPTVKGSLVQKFTEWHNSFE